MRRYIRIALVCLVELMLGLIVWMLWQPLSFPAPPGDPIIAWAVKIFFSIAFGVCMPGFLGACVYQGVFRKNQS